MRQLSLQGLFGGATADVQRTVEGSLEVWDLFCGAGGFSTGAIAAGCRVAFACDSSEEAIKTHTLNHPNVVHRCCELPCALPLPTDGRCFHMHGSPPCQRFSKINQKGRSDGDCKHAIDLVEWFIDFALASQATSWSMEQVASSYVVEIVERKRKQYQGKFSYAVIRLERLGVPQTRVRLLAGTPRLIAKLLRATEEQPRRSARSVIAKPRGTHIRGTATGVKQKRRPCAIKGEAKYNYKRAKWNDLCRTIDGPAPTVVGRHALTWITGNGMGANRSVLYTSELAALQTFPSGYKLPTNKYQAYLQVGNAIPPRVAELMLHGESGSPGSPPPSPPRPLPRPLSPSLRLFPA